MSGLGREVMYINDHICPVCEKEFDSMYEFIEHLDEHNTNDSEFEKSTKKKIEKDNKIRYG